MVLMLIMFLAGLLNSGINDITIFLTLFNVGGCSKGSLFCFKKYVDTEYNFLYNSFVNVRGYFLAEIIMHLARFFILSQLGGKKMLKERARLLILIYEVIEVLQAFLHGCSAANQSFIRSNSHFYFPTGFL